MIRSIVISMVLLAAGNFTAAQERTVKDYFPANEGSKWHYKSTSTLASKKDYKSETALVIEMDKVEKANEGVTAQLTPDSGVGSETVLLNSKGLFRTIAAGNSIDPPVRLLRMPIKDGDTWNYTYKVNLLGGVTMTESATVAFEKI